MISTLNVGARYFSIFLLCAGPFVGLNIQIAWETTVVPRPRTKRAALIAIANCVSSVSDVLISNPTNDNSPSATSESQRGSYRILFTDPENHLSSQVSHWFTPYFFLRSQEPRYQTGGGVIIAGCGFTVLSCLVAKWWATRKNAKLDALQEVSGDVNPWRYAT